MFICPHWASERAGSWETHRNMFSQGLNWFQGSWNCFQLWGLNLPPHCSLPSCHDDFKLLLKGKRTCSSLVMKFRCPGTDKSLPFCLCYASISQTFVPIWLKYEPAGWRTGTCKDQERSGHKSNESNSGSVLYPFECWVTKYIHCTSHMWHT